MLYQRFVSSVVLFIALFASFIAGYPYMNMFFGIGIAIMAWEWDNIINKKITPFAILYTAIGIFCLFLPLVMDLKLRIPLLTILITAIAIYYYAKRKALEHPRLLTFGVFYIALPALALNIISSANSMYGIIWIFAISWACDIGGFFFGSMLKGPKLCPSVSPNKTWSGFIGGLALACLFSFLYTELQGFEWRGVYVLTIALGIIAGLGDLLESSIKRYLGIKDTSNIIPGHGGIFDRIDSTILVVVVYATLVFVSDIGLINMAIF